MPASRRASFVELVGFGKRDYPTLDLASVYAVSSFVLRHRDIVNGYLADREKRSAEASEASPAQVGAR